MEEYLRATGVFSLALLAVSASFLFDPSRLWTLAALIPMTVLFGFVAFISREGFQKDSLAATPTLIFGFVDPVVGAASIVAAVASPLISVFTGGDSFRNYFGAVSMPLLISGLVLGGAAYVALEGSPALEDRAVNITSERVGSQTYSIVQESGMRERFRQSQVEMVRATSRASVGLTGAYLRNASLDREAKAKVVDTLRTARREVPERMVSNVENVSSSRTDLEPRLKNSVRDVVDGRMSVLAVPLVAGLLYALNPVVGILVGIWGVMFSRILGAEFE